MQFLTIRQYLKWKKKITGYADQQNGYRLGKLQEMVKDREACHAAVREVAKSRTRLSD